jgi:hypothetical protein
VDRTERGLLVFLTSALDEGNNPDSRSFPLPLEKIPPMKYEADLAEGLGWRRK